MKPASTREPALLLRACGADDGAQCHPTNLHGAGHSVAIMILRPIGLQPARCDVPQMRRSIGKQASSGSTNRRRLHIQVAWPATSQVCAEARLCLGAILGGAEEWQLSGSPRSTFAGTSAGSTVATAIVEFLRPLMRCEPAAAMCFVSGSIVPPLALLLPSTVDHPRSCWPARYPAEWPLLLLLPTVTVCRFALCGPGGDFACVTYFYVADVRHTLCLYAQARNDQLARGKQRAVNSALARSDRQWGIPQLGSPRVGA